MQHLSSKFTSTMRNLPSVMNLRNRMWHNRYTGQLNRDFHRSLSQNSIVNTIGSSKD